jgi:hypothetical protein
MSIVIQTFSTLLIPDINQFLARNHKALNMGGGLGTQRSREDLEERQHRPLRSRVCAPKQAFSTAAAVAASFSSPQQRQPLAGPSPSPKKQQQQQQQQQQLRQPAGDVSSSSSSTNTHIPTCRCRLCRPDLYDPSGCPSIGPIGPDRQSPLTHSPCAKGCRCCFCRLRDGDSNCLHGGHKLALRYRCQRAGRCPCYVGCEDGGQCTVCGKIK